VRRGDGDLRLRVGEVKGRRQGVDWRSCDRDLRLRSVQREFEKVCASW
jgi:hypothetical protein